MLFGLWISLVCFLQSQLFYRTGSPPIEGSNDGIGFQPGLFDRALRELNRKSATAQEPPINVIYLRKRVQTGKNKIFLDGSHKPLIIDAVLSGSFCIMPNVSLNVNDERIEKAIEV